MNLCIKEFLERNNIGLDAIDRRIYTVKDINELLDKNRILGSRIEKDVCIKDILGLNSPFEEIVLGYPDFMDSFFDENGSSYHSRSLGLLKLDPGSKEFKETFNWNPFNLIGADGKYFIAGDGNHRFSILRVLYLDRLRKCKTDKEREALDEEFTFHSEVCEIDPLKSYCKLLIGMYSDNLMDKTYFSGAYESNGRYFVARMFEDFNADYVEIPRDRYESVRNKILSFRGKKKNSFISSQLGSGVVPWIASLNFGYGSASYIWQLGNISLTVGPSITKSYRSMCSLGVLGLMTDRYISWPHVGNMGFAQLSLPIISAES